MAYVSISNYGSLSRNLNAIVEKCKRYGVYCEVRAIEHWFRMPPIKKYGRNSMALEKVYASCLSKDCITLLKGRLVHCPYIAHGLNLRALPDEPDNYVDLTATDDISELRRRAKDYIEDRKYFSLCDHCYPHPTLNIRNEDKVPPAEQISRPLQYHKFD